MSDFDEIKAKVRAAMSGTEKSAQATLIEKVALRLVEHGCPDAESAAEKIVDDLMLSDIERLLYEKTIARMRAQYEEVETKTVAVVRDMALSSGRIQKATDTFNESLAKNPKDFFKAMRDAVSSAIVEPKP